MLDKKEATGMQAIRRLVYGIARLPLGTAVELELIFDLTR
jgi:hypothetical protein